MALLTTEEIAETIKQVLEANAYEIGSIDARTVECAFIQGMMVAENRYVTNPDLVATLHNQDKSIISE